MIVLVVILLLFTALIGNAIAQHNFIKQLQSQVDSLQYKLLSMEDDGK